MNTSVIKHCLVFHVNPSTPSDCCLWNAALPWTGPLIRLDWFEVGLGIIWFSKWRTFFRLLRSTALWVYADMYHRLCFDSLTQTLHSAGWNCSSRSSRTKEWIVLNHGICAVKQLYLCITYNISNLLYSSLTVSVDFMIFNSCLW